MNKLRIPNVLVIMLGAGSNIYRITWTEIVSLLSNSNCCSPLNNIHYLLDFPSMGVGFTANRKCDLDET